MSRPSRARGLKLMLAAMLVAARRVAPLAGAWIETLALRMGRRCVRVAPLAGAWIETLKRWLSDRAHGVAPLAGAWIET